MSAIPPQNSDPTRGFSFASLLSDPKYAVFDFGPGDTSALSTDQERQIASHLMDVLLATFLDKIGFVFQPPSLDKQVHADLETWTALNMIPLCQGDTRKIEAVTASMRVAASISDYFYPHADRRSRLLIAMASTAGISLDDFVGEAEMGRFGSFAYDLLMGNLNFSDAASDGWLGMYTRVMREYVSYFGEGDARVGALGGDFLVKFLSSTANENRFRRLDTLPPHLRPSMSSGESPHGCCPEGFPYWHRYQSGASGAYIPPLFRGVPFDYWVTSVPHLVRFTNFTNDLLSFQKEVLGGGGGAGSFELNYMALQVLARRQARVPSQLGPPGSLWTYRDAMREIMDETHLVVYELDKAFVEFPKYVRVCELGRRNGVMMLMNSLADTAMRSGAASGTWMLLVVRGRHTRTATYCYTLTR